MAQANAKKTFSFVERKRTILHLNFCQILALTKISSTEWCKANANKHVFLRRAEANDLIHIHFCQNFALSKISCTKCRKRIQFFF